MGSRWRLDGKKALVTGATKGIGRAIVEELLALGAQVFIAARTAEDVESRLNEWAAQNKPVDGIAADVSSAEGRQQIISECKTSLGALDILLNNVGTNIRKPVNQYTAEEYDFIMRTNLTSTFEMSRLAYPLLKDSGDAAIVNIGSVAGLTHLRTGAPYAMTKAALVQLTRNLAVEWAQDRIRVNMIAPWYTRTPLVETLLTDAQYYEEILDRTPVKRIAEADEVAAAAVFFCLPAASYITGQCLPVDGGFTIYGF